MANFTAKVTENVQEYRLLSMSTGDDGIEVAATESGGQPDFRSTRELEEGEEITVNILNNPSWEIEAGEDLSAGTTVAVGDGGVVVASEDNTVGFVAEAAEEGELVEVIKSGGSGEQGPRGQRGPRGEQGPEGEQGPQGEQGPPGEDGADGQDAENQFTEEQRDALLALIEEED